MDIRQRLLARYVSTHSSVADAAAGLERRRPYLDRLVRDHFPSDRSARILDLGCGHGAILWAAARAGYTQLAGVDASPEQVAAAQRLNIPGVRLGDLMETLAAAPDASLDAVVLFDLFHYFPPEQQAAIADAVQRVLKPGGRWIVHVPNGEALFGARMRYWDYLAGGFADVRCYEDRPIPHGAKSAVRWVVWMGVRAALRLALAAETGETGREAIFSQCLLAVAIK
jgi:SAM-dependent methyltransferase